MGQRATTALGAFKDALGDCPAAKLGGALVWVVFSTVTSATMFRNVARDVALDNLATRCQLELQKKHFRTCSLITVKNWENALRRVVNWSRKRSALPRSTGSIAIVEVPVTKISLGRSPKEHHNGLGRSPKESCNGLGLSKGAPQRPWKLSEERRDGLGCSPKEFEERHCGPKSHDGLGSVQRRFGGLSRCEVGQRVGLGGFLDGDQCNGVLKCRARRCAG